MNVRTDARVLEQWGFTTKVVPKTIGKDGAVKDMGGSVEIYDPLGQLFATQTPEGEVTYGPKYKKAEAPKQEAKTK